MEGQGCKTIHNEKSVMAASEKLERRSAAMSTSQSVKKRKPIVEGYFTWPSDEPRLIGSRCKSCNHYFFPKSNICQYPKCKNKDVEEVTLSRKGKLWSYTFVFFQPPPPFRMEPFVPYGVGMVELPEGIKVLAMLTGCKLDDLKVGLDVELVVETMYKDELQNEYVTWKFKPVA
jgi:uncharacterized OB-fold protein